MDKPQYPLDKIEITRDELAWLIRQGHDIISNIETGRTVSLVNAATFLQERLKKLNDRFWGEDE